MKRVFASFFVIALLSGCVAVPHDGYTTYHSSTVVTTGHYPYGAPVYVEQAPVYVHPAPVYMRPAPIYVGPPIHLHYSRGPRHDGRHYHGPHRGHGKGGDGHRRHGPYRQFKHR